MEKFILRLFERINTLIKIIKTYKNFPAYFINRLGFYKRPTLTLFLRNGIRYKIRNRNITTADYYVINESWIHKIHNGAKKYIKDGSLVIDIGAHIGAFSIFAASQAKNVKILSLEPVVENFELLKTNIQINNFNKCIKPIKMAVAGATGKKKIFLDEKDSGKHIFYPKIIPESRFREVGCLSLSEIFDSYKINQCDVLKMDCEGAEYEILYNTSPQYFQKIRCLSIEYHDNGIDNINELKIFLENNGFNISRPKDNFGVIFAENIKN